MTKSMNEGLVIQSTGMWYKVKSGDRIIDSRLPGKFRLNEEEVTNPVAVGDRVELSIEQDNTGIIRQIHERKNYIPRQATHGRRGEQVLVANVDLAWVVLSIRNPHSKRALLIVFSSPVKLITSPRPSLSIRLTLPESVILNCWMNSPHCMKALATAFCLPRSAIQRA